MRALSVASDHRSGMVRGNWIIAVAMLIGMIGCATRQPIVARDDAAISDDVRGRLAADVRASPLKVAVDTKVGVVRLTGSVPTDDDRNAVERIARDVPGVRAVDNNVIFGDVPAPIVR